MGVHKLPMERKYTDVKIICCGNSNEVAVVLQSNCCCMEVLTVFELHRKKWWCFLRQGFCLQPTCFHSHSRFTFAEIVTVIHFIPVTCMSYPVH